MYWRMKSKDLMICFRLSFTITFIECKPLCLMSLIIGSALTDNVFKGDFLLLKILLKKSRLGDQKYLHLQ